MKKALLVVALAVLAGFTVTGKAMAAQGPALSASTEVCVNASLVNEAKRRFPGARLHIRPDSTDPNMNGWRIVYGTSHKDGEELSIRVRENRTARVIE